jgi:hypothetical protein
MVDGHPFGGRQRRRNVANSCKRIGETALTALMRGGTRSRVDRVSCPPTFTCTARLEHSAAPHAGNGRGLARYDRRSRAFGNAPQAKREQDDMQTACRDHSTYISLRAVRASPPTAFARPVHAGMDTSDARVSCLPNRRRPDPRAMERSRIASVGAVEGVVSRAFAERPSCLECRA